MIWCSVHASGRKDSPIVLCMSFMFDLQKCFSLYLIILCCFTVVIILPGLELSLFLPHCKLANEMQWILLKWFWEWFLKIPMRIRHGWYRLFSSSCSSPAHTFHQTTKISIVTHVEFLKRSSCTVTPCAKLKKQDSITSLDICPILSIHENTKLLSQIKCFTKITSAPPVKLLVEPKPKKKLNSSTKETKYP